jgi:hypothetical protein
MNARGVWKIVERWARRVRTTAPPGWERTRARGPALYLAARGATGAFIVGAYFAAQAAIERTGAAAPAFFSGDYFSDWTKGLGVGLVGGCALGLWDWRMNEGAYRAATKQSPPSPRDEPDPT